MVALKIPRPGTLVDRSDTERFLRKARSVARLHHPGIVALHEIGQTPDGACFLVEEFIHGQSLANCCAAGAVQVGPPCRFGKRSSCWSRSPRRFTMPISTASSTAI